MEDPALNHGNYTRHGSYDAVQVQNIFEYASASNYHTKICCQPTNWYLFVLVRLDLLYYGIHINPFKI